MVRRAFSSGAVFLVALSCAFVASACSDEGDSGAGSAGNGGAQDAGGGSSGSSSGSGGAGTTGSGATGGSAGTAGSGATAGSAGASGGAGASGSGGGADAGGSADSGTGGATCRNGARPPCARTGGTGTLCPGVGWCEIADTKLETVCAATHGFEEVHGVEGCAGIINDWSGGIADLAHHRLIVWGGGHDGYYGNELYAFDLASREFQRLTDPSPPAPGGNSCPEALSDGTPNSRHTYNGLAEIRHLGRMWAFGGSLACGPGNFGNDTWILDLSNFAWTRSEPAGGPVPSASPGVAADYDPSTNKIFLHDTATFFRYDPDTSVYERLSEQSIDYHLTGVIDPKRRVFVLFGGGQVRAFDIGPTSSFEMQTWDDQVTGCNALRESVYPGLAYDPVQDRIVGWAGGDTAYVFDVDSKSCIAVTHAGGPGPQPEAGTHGRFRYFPEYGVFAIVNDWQQNAYTLRLSP